MDTHAYPWGHLENNAELPTEEQRELLENCLESPPVRCARNFGCNLIGLFPSLKNGRSVEFESGSIERLIVFLLENCTQVLRFKEQPLTLQVPRENKKGIKAPQRYTPDYAAQLASGQFIFLEGKPEKKLSLHAQRGGTYYYKDAEGRWRDPSAEEVCRKMGADHLILTESDFWPNLMRNLHFLFEFIPREEPDNVFADIIRKSIARNQRRFVSLADLKLDQDGMAKIYGLIGTGRILSTVNYRSIHEPERFLLFSDQAAFAGWELNQTPKRCLKLRMFQLVAGTKFSWREEHFHVKQVHGDQIIVGQGVHTDTYSLDHLRREWESGFISVHTEGETDREPAVQLPSGHALKEALRRLEITKGATSEYSDRTVRRWKQQKKMAEAAGICVVDALSPKTSRRGSRLPRLDMDTLSDLDEYLQSDFFLPHAPKAIRCFNKYQQQQRECGKIPVGRSTFYTRIKALQNLHNRTRVGKKKHYAMLSGLQDYNGIPVLVPDSEFAFGTGHIDHTPVDVILLNAKGELVNRRIWLTVMKDAYSRFIPAWYFSFRAPSRVSCMMVVRECIRRHGRLPRTIIVDNGSEFHSHFFRRLVIGLNSELLYRPPHMPRHGSISERFFRTVNDGLFHNIPGNTQQLKDPRSMGRDVDPRRLAVETFETLYEQFEHWVLNVYHHRPHQGLGATPNQVFRDSCTRTGILLRNSVLADQRFLCESAIEVDGLTRVLHTNWVVVNNIRYKSNEIRNPKYAGRKVEIRWDPEDIRVVYVLLGDSWIVAKSKHYDSITNCDQQRLRVVSEVFVDGVLSAARHNCAPSPAILERGKETVAAETIEIKDGPALNINSDEDEDWTRYLT